MNWKTQITVATDTRVNVTVTPAGAKATELREAALLYRARKDAFADGKESTCIDMANKLERYGDFASEKQAQYADKLIAWSKPRGFVAAPAVKLPRLFAVLQRHADFHVGSMKISRRNQDTLCWITYSGDVVGKIEAAEATIWASKCANALTSRDAVVAILEELEANPLEAAKKYGRESGRCCSCGRDLTDPASIENGIGPICIQKFA